MGLRARIYVISYPEPDSGLCVRHHPHLEYICRYLYRQRYILHVDRRGGFFRLDVNYIAGCLYIYTLLYFFSRCSSLTWLLRIYSYIFPLMRSEQIEIYTIHPGTVSGELHVCRVCTSSPLVYCPDDQILECYVTWALFCCTRVRIRRARGSALRTIHH